MHPIAGARSYTVLVSLLSLFSLPIAVPLSAQSVTMGVGSADAPAGGDVEVPVFFREAGKVGVFEFEFVYDAAVVELSEVSLGDDLQNAMVEHTLTPEPGRAWVAVITPEVLEGDLAEVLTARFDVLGDEGSSSTVGIENALAWEDGTDLEMLVDTEAGMLNVTGAAPLPWSYLLAALAALLTLVLVLFWWRRRRRERPVPAAAAPSGAAPSGPAASAGGASGSGTGARFCSGCGSRLSEGARFCPGCGQGVGG